MTHEVDSEYIFRIASLGDAQEFTDILDLHPTLNINIQNENGESLLIHCVRRLETKWKALIGGEFRAICKILIKRNIDVNLKDASGKTAANYAAALQQLEVLRWLIQEGAHLDKAVLDSVIDKEDWILAICASLPSDSELEGGTENEKVHAGEKVKLKLFHRLLSSTYLSSIRWMCELFPEIIEKKNDESLTALHIAVIENNVTAMNILLEFKANFDAVDCKGHTALHFAVDYGHIECMLSLLNGGSAVNCQDVSGSTPLHYAINVGSDDKEDNVSSDVMIEHLMKFGADTTLAERNGRLPLHWAANAGNANVCVMMVENGSSVNTRCNNGHTALHIAASQGHTECIRVLVVECGADVDIEDNYGYTPLFNAITSRNLHCADLLLYKDASPNHRNKQGNSPAHLAASKGLTEVLEMLVKYRGSLELRNNSEDLPIHEAVLFQQQDAVNYLLKCRCNVNARNKQGFTPLHLAASVGSKAVCECLLKGGAEVNCINTQCKNGIYKFLTPLDLAYLNKHSECVKYLQNRRGSRGDQIVMLASSKIQRWWKKRRTPKRILQSIQENTDEETSPQETTQSTNDTKCATRSANADEQAKDENISEHKNDNDQGNTISIQNVPIGTNDTKRTSISSLHATELKTRSSKNVKNEGQLREKPRQEVDDKLSKSRYKSSRLNKTALAPPKKLASCVRKPTRKNTPRNSTVKESEQAIKITAHQYKCKPSSARRLKETEKFEEKSKTTTSNVERSDTTQERLKHSLEMEIARKEKLSKEIARLKENLEERSQNLGKRLRVIERNLEKL